VRRAKRMGNHRGREAQGKFDWETVEIRSEG